MAERSTVARPYAEAMFKASKSNGENTNDWESWLIEMAGALKDSALQKVIGDKRYTTEMVTNLLTDLISPPTEVAKNALRLLIEGKRLSLIDEISSQFVRLRQSDEEVATAKITTAFSLDDGQVADLLKSLERKFGRKLVPEVTVDSELIGGVRIQVGDEVLDSSVKNAVERLKNHLATA